MKAYRLCGRYRNERKDQYFNNSLEDDQSAQEWVRRFCKERRSFRPARLVEVIRAGDYREIPLPTL